MIRDARNILGNDYDYVINKFRAPVFEEDTGLELNELKARLLEMANELADEPRAIAKAKMMAFICDHLSIDVSEHDFFPAFSCWNRAQRPLGPVLNLWKKELFDKLPGLNEELHDLLSTGSLNIYPDFDHCVPDWDALYTLGFSGLRQRAKQFRAEREADHPLSVKEAAYFDSIDLVYDAVLRLMDRLYQMACRRSKGNDRLAQQAECLHQLLVGAPRNTYEVLQLIYIYFFLSEHIGHLQVRSLGNLDQYLLPYYHRDLEDGTLTKESFIRLFSHFLMQYASINNYWGHPFYLCGTLEDGSSATNELTYLILDCFYNLNICTPKLQLKIAENTPDELLRFALERVRHGNTSLTFIGEKGIARALGGLGYSPEEIRTCDITGCYEYDLRAREVKTAPIYLNIPKAMELAMHNGVDPITGIDLGLHTGDPATFTTYDAFYQAFIRQLHMLIERSLKCCDRFEACLDEINPTPLFSATILNSLQTAEDAFARGSVYNHSSLLQAGLATTVDSLLMVRKYVYERKELTLSELVSVLEADWEGNELLRLRILRDHERYGNGLARPDQLGENLARFIGQCVTLRPNARGGFWKASMHSARHFINFGKELKATPDGRRAGEEISKNASPVMGQDVSGVTALERSVTAIDTALYPEDFCMDVMMLPASVEGEEGLQAMIRLMRTYMDHNGTVIQFNVFDENMLLDAQAHPENYQNLQVRVCGWNVLFNTMDKVEQDKYIERARNIIQ